MKKFVILLLAIVLGAGAITAYQQFDAEEPAAAPRELPSAPVSEVQSPLASTAAAEPRESAAPAVPEPVAAEAGPPEAPEAAAETSLRWYGVVEDADSSAPVSGAALRLLLRGEVLAEGTSDADGAFTVSAELAQRDRRRALLVCEAQGYARETRTLEGETLLEGTELRTDFLLSPAALLSGRVYQQDTGAGVEEVALVLQPRVDFRSMAAGRGWQRQGSELRTQSGENGTYRFESVPPGDYHLLAKAGEMNLVMADAELTVLRLDTGTPTTRDIALTPGAVVIGEITLPPGVTLEEEPVVSFRRVEKLDVNTMSQSMTRLMQMEPQPVKDGAYEYSGLRFDTPYRGQVNAPGLPPITGDVFTIPPGQSPFRVDFQLVTGSTIRGTVAYADGRPAGHVEVQVMPDMAEVMQGNFQGFSESADTDAHGNFTLTGVPAGTFTVMVGELSFSFSEADNRAVVETDGTSVVEGVALMITDGDGASPPRDAFVTGQVVDAGNAPVAGAKVHAESGMMARANATSDAAGRFRIERLRAGSYALRAEHKLGEARLESVATGSDVVMKLGPVTRISGFVLDAGGNPVRRCAVRLEKQREGTGMFDFDPGMMEEMMGGGQQATETNEFGHFEFLHMAAANYVVKALAKGYGSGESGVVKVAANTQHDNLSITLTPGVRFSGTVIDAAGAPIEGARVALSASRGDGNAFQEQMAQFMPSDMQQVTAEAFSDASGVFAMEGVPPGGYRLSASRTGFARTVEASVTIEAGRDRSGHTIRMTVGGCVTGTPLMDGTPKLGLMVMAMGGAGMQQTTTDVDGHFELCGLAPGTYMLQIMDMGAMMGGQMGMPLQRSVEVVDGETTEVNFGPAAGAVAVAGSISGINGGITTVTLRNPNSPAPGDINPFDMAEQLALMQEMGGTAILNADGTFTMPDVVPGDYILEVYSMDFDPENPDMTEVMEAGRAPVLRQEITIAPGEQPRLDLVVPAE